MGAGRPLDTECQLPQRKSGKRGITLDLQNPAGQGVLNGLLSEADVLIHNFLPKTAERLGLKTEPLLERNPRLVVCTISAYGARGPLRDHPGYDGVLQAFSGIMGITGTEDGAPVRTGPSVIDMSAGLIAYGGVMTALFGRDQGGDRHVQTSLLEAAITLLGFHGIAWLELGIQPKPAGSGLWNLVPYQAFQCSDAYIMTGALNDGTWRRLCVAVGRNDLSDNPEFATVASRLGHRDELLATFAEIFRTRSSSEWIPLLEAAGVPVCPIHTLEQILTHEQVTTNGMVTTTGAPDDRGVAPKMIGLPFKLGNGMEISVLPPPLLGQHVPQVLGDWLGLDGNAIDELSTQGAFAPPRRTAV